MRQKVKILWLSNCLGLFFLLISVPLLLPAQEEHDSLRVFCGQVQPKPGDNFQLPTVKPFLEKLPIYSSYSFGQVGSLSGFPPKENLYMPYMTNPSPIYRGDYHTGGVWRQFRYGILFGSGSQTSIPGIGQINEAALGYQHDFNSKLALQFSVNAMKINMAHITGQAFSASGVFLYHPSDRLTFKLFGSYSLGNSYGMDTHSYGATMSVDMSECFNLEMGVQRYYDTMRGRWETVPVVIPSYRFNKFTLGLDAGGLVYEIFRTLIFDKRGNGSPTIASPRFSMPAR